MTSTMKNHFNFKKIIACLFQRLDICNQRCNLSRLKFPGKRRHLSRLTFADPIGNPIVGKTQTMQVRTIVTVCAGTMTMRTVS